ncbi:MAG: hypothetical protein LBE56_09025 [Tannerella sp.]|jgi:MFS family permease|nr:hypothetical protein [Tannerella sp.]
MDNKEVLSTLSDIRNMMEKSSRILSLSGMSAVVVGVFAGLAAVVAHVILGGGSLAAWLPRFDYCPVCKVQMLVLLAGFLILVCMATAYLFARRKAKRKNQRFAFDLTARRLLWNFFMPLAAGGVLCVSFLWQQQYDLLSAIMLIFYGLALINLSNYTYSNTRYLGYAQLLLGLADSFVPGHSLLFWTAGFGLFHIVYGIYFYLKFDRQNTMNER